MVLKYLNPFFLLKKRKSIKTRVKEIPSDILWNFFHKMISIGYIYNEDYAKIKKLKNIHKGKKAFLIGNGPSVKAEDLELFKSKDYITFCANRINLAYDQFTFRPDYVVSSDIQMINDFGQEIVSNNNNVIIVSKTKPDFNGDYTWFRLSKRRPFKFPKDISKEVLLSGGTLVTALQIGFHMGITEFYLYGVDHSFNYKSSNNKKSLGNATGDNNHFIKNYRSNKPWQAPIYDLVEEGFKKSNDHLKKHKGKVINCTHGGKLEVLKREDFYNIINER